MLRSNRGAARISAVWMISVGVVALAAVAFAFIAQDDLAGETAKLDAAKSSEAEATASLLGAREVRQNVSAVLGFYDKSSADPSSDTEAAKAALGTLTQTFPDLTDTDADFESVIPKIVTAHNQRGSEIAGLETQIQSLRAQADAANAAVRQVTQAKDQVISDLRSQLQDEQQNSADRQKELEGRVASVQQQLSDSDAEARRLRSELANQKRTADKAASLASATIMNLRHNLSFASEDAKRKPDGKVLDVSSTLPLAWINLGANQRVARGMRFEVLGGNPGSERLKAWAEVTRVDANRSEVAIQSLVDRWDPVAAGDVVVNEIFDAVGTRNAVLAGNFTGQYSRPELVALLDNLGVFVQDDVDYSTHFLIVGAPLYHDPETNEPLEEPLSPSELDIYKKAVSANVQILPLDRLRQFFRVGA